MPAPCAPPDARVLEEDTALVLSADPRVRDPGTPLVRIMIDLHEQILHRPGTVIVREGRPLRLLAVVHDLDREPSWREEWITAALEETLAICAARQLAVVEMQPLGTCHGRLPMTRFHRLLERGLADHRAAFPARVRLVYGIAPVSPAGTPAGRSPTR